MIQGLGAVNQQLYSPPANNGPRQVPAESGSGALPEAPTPFDIALQIQEVQTENIQRALDAQTQILDLLA